MISQSLVIRTVIVEAVALATAIALFFGHAFWLWRYRARTEPRLARAREASVRLLNAARLESSGESVSAREDLEAVRALPRALQTQSFVELARNLSGTEKDVVTDFARRLGLIAEAEDGLESRLWWRRLQAARFLTVVGGGESIMPEHLTDLHFSVRAQAAEWAASFPSLNLIPGLLALLTDPAKLCRFIAQNALLRMGGVTVPYLTDYLAGCSGSAAETALEVAIGVAEPQLLAPALQLVQDGAPRIRALAAALLGQLGGAEAVTALMERLNDPDLSVRAAAARGLRKLGRWQAAPMLAHALGDRAWDVRREAALALRALGSPGILMLRRSLSDADAFAADMARQVLDIPESAVARPVE